MVFLLTFIKKNWRDFKHLVLRAINVGFKKGCMSTTMKQCIINCLPKPGKPRNFLKNWRPISLLNVTYKLASAALAARLKKVLPKIISNTQTGFLQDRFIGETTRLVYDLMCYTEQKKINGIIMLIDFEKAFDSISWNFLIEVLTFFNFSEDTISKILTLNNNILASVQQCGFLSEFFEIQRGCRQGDPIAPYEFILVAQILYLMITFNKNIKGITIDGIEYKLSQFADDTTTILDGTQASLQAALNTLEVFGTYSGLKINKDKTKIIWIGNKKHSKIKLNTTPELHWGSTDFVLLGISFSVDLASMIELNYNKYIQQTIDTINHWNKRYLTPLGKITVIKTFILSRFTHLFTSLPIPPEHFIKKLTQLIISFLWNNKPSKIKQTRMEQDLILGGLKLTNIKSFILSLQITWIRRLIQNKYTPWSQLFNSTISDPNKLIELGPMFSYTLSNNISNLFWKGVLKSWNLFSISEKQSEINSKPENFLYKPLWYNQTPPTVQLFVKEWYTKGIIITGDILTDNNTLHTAEYLQHKYKIKPPDYLTFHRIKRTIKPTTMENHIQIQRPYIPIFAKTLLKDKKGIKNIYKQLISCNTSQYSNSKWNRDLNIFIDTQTWSNTFKICFHTITDNYIIWLQYRLLHRIIGCKYLLHKMKITDNDICDTCNNNSQTLIHLFTECDSIKQLWIDLQQWIKNKTNINVEFTPIIIILGYMNDDNFKIPLNTIILVTKSYIFWCSKNKKVPTIFLLQNRIIEVYNTQYMLARLNNKDSQLTKQWKHFIPITIHTDP